MISFERGKTVFHEGIAVPVIVREIVYPKRTFSFVNSGSVMECSGVATIIIGMTPAVSVENNVSGIHQKEDWRKDGKHGKCADKKICEPDYSYCVRNMPYMKRHERSD